MASFHSFKETPDMKNCYGINYFTQYRPTLLAFIGSWFVNNASNPSFGTFFYTKNDGK